MLRHTLAHPIIILTLALISICAAAQQHPHRRAVSSTAKAGLAWPNGPYADIDQFTTTGKVQWYYTWSPSGFPSTLEFVPMLWGPSQLSSWTANINHTISQLHISSVLGFNEPQEVSQSNISPTDAAALWAQHIEPLKAQGIRLGSPAPSSAPSGKTWLMQWLDACGAVGGCTVDFVALHWYDINSTAFIEYLQDFHDTFQRPIWVTEWACQNFNKADDQCSPQDIVNFMNATQEFMDNTEWVERYAWFGAFMDLQGVNQDDALMTSSGGLTTLGKQYIGAVVPNVTNTMPGVVTGGNGSARPAPGSPGSSSNAGRAMSVWKAGLVVAVGALLMLSI